MSKLVYQNLSTIWLQYEERYLEILREILDEIQLQFLSEFTVPQSFPRYPSLEIYPNWKKFEERKLNFEFLRRNVTSSDFGIYSREYY